MITAEIKDDVLIIKIPCKDKPYGLSKSGKTKVVASTNGNLATPCIVENKQLVIGVNAYIPL